MNELLWWFGQNTLAALLMIPCVMLACRLFRDRPAVQHLLWLVILAKFVTPPIVVWPWSVEELRSLAWTPTTEVQMAEMEPLPAIPGAKVIESYEPAEEPLLVPINTLPNLERDVLPTIVQIVTEPIANAAQLRPTVQWNRVVSYALISIWFAGAIVCLASQFRRLVRFARLIHSGTIAPSHLKSEVTSVAALLRMKSPVSVVVKGFASPFLWCVGAARLAWPESISSPEDVKRSRGIIAHELAHLRRRDHWITWLELGASILWWWNPLFWYVRRQVRETAEMSCDAMAIAANPGSRHAYAELLLQLSSQATNGVPAPVLAVGAGNVASFERRLKMILSSGVSGKLSWSGAVAMAVLAAIAFPYWSLAQSEEKSQPTSPVRVTYPKTEATGTVIAGIRYLRPPAIAQSLAVEEEAWGAEVDGLKAAFLMSDVVGRSDGSMFVNGALIVRNVSDKPIWFSETASMAVPDIYDSSDKRLPLRAYPFFSSLQIGNVFYRSCCIVRRTILAPGEQCVLDKECELPIYLTDRERQGANDIRPTDMSVIVPPGKYSVAVSFMPGLRSENEWDEQVKQSKVEIALPDFYENGQVVSRSVPGEWFGSLLTGRVSFTAFDKSGATKINESRKVAANANDNLRIGSRDGRLTFFKRDGVLRLHDQMATYALLAFVPANDGRIVIEGALNQQSLCMRTLIDVSDSQLKVLDLCSGDLLAQFNSNEKGELELQNNLVQVTAPVDTSKVDSSEAGDNNAPLDKASQADHEALQRLVRGGKIETKSLQAMISQVARRGAMDAEFAQLVMSDFEKSGTADGGTIRLNRDLLAVFAEMFELWGEPRWRTQLARRASTDPKDQQNAQAVPPEALSKLETQLLSTLVRHAYNADRSNIATYTLAVRQLHSQASREFLRDVLRNPDNDGAYSPADPLAPENRTLPAPKAAQAGPQTQPMPQSKTAPLESKWKDNIGDGWGDAKFVAAVGLAELNDAEGVEWLLSMVRDNDFGIDGSIWHHRHVRDSSGSLRASSRASLTDLFRLRTEPSFEQLMAAWGDQKAQFIASPVALILGFNQPQKVVAQAEIGNQSGNDSAAGNSLPPNIETLLDWGAPVDGLRGAVMIQTAVQKPEMANRPKIFLVLQNVSDRPIRFCDKQMIKNDDVQVREDKRTLYLRDEEGILSGFSSSGGTDTDVMLQPRDVVMIDLFYGAKPNENGRPISAAMVETIVYDSSLSYSVTINLVTAPPGAWSGKLTTPQSRGAALADGSLPKNADAQLLFRYCIDHARLSGEIPGGTMSLLRAKVQYFIELNTGDQSGDSYAKKMQPIMARFEKSGDWLQADVATLFDDIAAVTTIPLETTLEAIREHTLQRGLPLPTSLQNANWGAALAGGLRMAWILEPAADQVHLGSSLKSRVVINNSGKEPVAFVTRSFHQPTHLATNAAAKAIQLESIMWTTIGRPEPYRLHPGEYCEVAAPGIGIGPRNSKVDDWANIRPGTWIQANEGDEVQFQSGDVWLTGDHNQTIDADWWWKFVTERVDRESPIPAGQDERKLILFRVVQDLFGTSPQTTEADAFYADTSPEALRNLALLLSKRTWLTPVTGSIKSGPTKFKVLPADPNVSTRPRIVATPGRYNVGDELRLEVTRNSNGGSIRNDVHLTWYPKGKDSVPTSISVPVGYNTWSAGWLPGTSMIWVATKDSLRSYDCTNPASIQVKTFDVEQQTTAPIASELRALLFAEIATSENPRPVIGPPAATAGDRK